MLKIVPMTKSEEQERICSVCGLEYDGTQLAYGAYEDGDAVGASQFTVRDGIGYITDIKCNGEDNAPLVMLLGRAVLNFLDLHGIKEAFFEPRGELYDKQALLIGFKLREGKLYADLRGMFTTEHEKLPH